MAKAGENLGVASIGRNIQQLRKERRLSMDSLAGRSDVSKAMLSQVEKGKVNPTIGILWKIADGLGVQVRDLISSEERRLRFQVIDISNSTVLKSDDQLCDIQILSPPKMIESVELYLLHFKSGGTLASQPHSPHTEEFLTVLEGKLEIRAGEKVTEVEPYSSIHYSADVPHTIANKSSAPAKAYLAVRYQ